MRGIGRVRSQRLLSPVRWRGLPHSPSPRKRACSAPYPVARRCRPRRRARWSWKRLPEPRRPDQAPSRPAHRRPEIASPRLRARSWRARPSAQRRDAGRDRGHAPALGPPASAPCPCRGPAPPPRRHPPPHARRTRAGRRTDARAAASRSPVRRRAPVRRRRRHGSAPGAAHGAATAHHGRPRSTQATARRRPRPRHAARHCGTGGSDSRRRSSASALPARATPRPGRPAPAAGGPPPTALPSSVRHVDARTDGDRRARLRRHARRSRPRHVTAYGATSSTTRQHRLARPRWMADG